MKQFTLLVSLILLSSSAIRDNYKEQPSLADPNNPLSLTCPGFFLNVMFYFKLLSKNQNYHLHKKNLMNDHSGC